MNSTAKGYICGIIAASCYGLSPLGGVNLMNLGMNAASALFNWIFHAKGSGNPRFLHSQSALGIRSNLLLGSDSL